VECLELQTREYRSLPRRTRIPSGASLLIAFLQLRPIKEVGVQRAVLIAVGGQVRHRLLEGVEGVAVPGLTGSTAWYRGGQVDDVFRGLFGVDVDDFPQLADESHAPLAQAGEVHVPQAVPLSM